MRVHTGLNAASIVLAAAALIATASSPASAASNAKTGAKTGAKSAAQPAAKALTTAELIASSQPGDWRTPDTENTLYLELATGRVVIELAPAFAPLHAANIRTLVREKYFDGLTINRAQDNFVVQWGDADGNRALGTAREKLAPEFTRAYSSSLGFAPVADRDGYAPVTGFAGGFPAARDPATGQAWLAHCYGSVGAGRDNSPESGSGAELYVVIGQSPRQLDRNIAVVGRVLAGMELLSILPRGTGALGFYEKPEQRTLMQSIRVAADVPASERTNLQVLRTDTKLFTRIVESRRNRRDEWYLVPAGHIDLCNITIPVRTVAATAAPTQQSPDK